MKKKLDFSKYLSFVFLLIVGLSTFISSTSALFSDNIKSLADTPTNTAYNNIINENNIGKVWTDKSVFNTDMTIENKVISKDSDEDFLISLSALSVGIDLNLKEGNVKDIVLLLDVSGSMTKNKLTTSEGESITRLEASQRAINNLLDVILAANKSLSDNDEKFRVSLVTFSSNSAQTAGKATIIFDLKEVIEDQPNNENQPNEETDKLNDEEIIAETDETTIFMSITDMKNAVNNIDHGGTTWIGTGFAKCETEINNFARKNVDTAIVAFMDGLPNPESQGNTAVKKAKELKSAGVVIYSVIMNESAKGGTSTSIDKVGQAISSNYDEATSSSKLGYQTGDSYYYTPDTAAELINSFEDIIKKIQSKVYALDQESSLTFTDKLGEYMEINKIKALIYKGNVYTNVESSINGNIMTYTFSNDVEDSLGQSANTNEITIEVTKSADSKIGDIITVKIPSNLVPLVIYDVTSTFLTDSTVYTTKVEEEKPISIVYSTNVKNEVNSLYKANDNGIKEYITKNGYIEGEEGYANFFSNYYNEGNNGTTEVTFTPYYKNNYYYYDNTYLYAKSGDSYTFYTGAELPEGSYFTKKTIYNVGTQLPLIETYEEVKDVTKAEKDSSNQWYFSSGTEKEIVSTIIKSNNETQTASNVNNTNWDDKEVKSFLGNNGVILVHMEPDKVEIENPYTGFKTAVTVIVLCFMLTFVCYYFKDRRNRLYKI